jgi:hypothetical protein
MKPCISATKVRGLERQGMADGMGWTARIGIIFIVLLILAAAGLAIYASRLVPPHQTYQQVIPNDRFAG